MSKKKYVSDKEFAEIMLSLEQVQQFMRGERNDFRTTVWIAPRVTKSNLVTRGKAQEQPAQSRRKC